MVWGPVGWLIRVMLFAGGLALMLPGGPLIGYTNLQLSIASFVLLVPAVALAWFANRTEKPVAAE